MTVNYGKPQPAITLLIRHMSGIAVLVVSAFMAVFVFRLDLATVAIRHILTDNGLAPAALRVEEADLGRLVLSEISAGAGTAVAIRRLSVAYTPTALLERRIDRVDVEGLMITVRADSDGVSVDGLDAITPLTRSDGDGGEWAITSVGFTDASVSVRGSVGARLTFAGEVLAIGNNRYRGDLRFQGNAGIPDTERSDVEGTITFSASATAVEEVDLVFTLRNLPLPDLGNADLDATATVQDGDVHVVGRIQTRQGHVAFDVAGSLPANGDWGSLRGMGTMELDLAEVNIDDAEVTLSAAGRVETRVEGDSLAVRALDPVEIKAVTTVGPLTARLEPADAPILSAEHERGRIHSVTVHVADATVSAVDHSFRITEGDAAIMLHPLPTLELRSLRLADTGQPPLAPPLSVTGRATLEQAHVPFSATIAAAGGKAHAAMSGAWDRKAGTGHADIELQPLRFSPDTLQPRDLAPALTLPIAKVSGGISVQGSVGWRDERMRLDLRLRIENTALTVNDIGMQGIAGTIRLTDLDPPGTPRGQVITIDRIDAGVPLTETELRFQLDDRRRLLIERAGVNLLGGRVSQTNAVFDAAKPSYRGTLDVTGISLQSLLELAELDGATATGHVGGRIPIVYDDGELSITQGSLATVAPGVLRYAPAHAPSALQAQGEAIDLALKALENFHYDSLSVAMDGGSGRGWTSRVHLAGKNPDFMEGYPFTFNINLSGDLDRVVLSGLLGMTLHNRIQDRL